MASDESSFGDREEPRGRRAARRTDNPLDTLADYAFPVFERYIGQDSDFTQHVRVKLAEARKSTTAELYISRAIGIGVVSGISLWLTMMFLVWGVLAVTGFDPGVLVSITLPDHPILVFLVEIRVILAAIVAGIVFGAIGGMVGFWTPILRIYFTADDRGREIDMLLPDAISYMYALSVGGMNQLEVLEAVASSEDVYGEVATEFQIIMQETNYFDTDYRTAIRSRAIETPSEDLQQFLTDMLSILSSGGDMADFLDDKKDKYMREAKLKREQNLETLEMFGEMYMTLSMFPLLLIILLVIMRMMGGGSKLLLYGSVYGLIPIIGVAFLLLIAMVKQDERGGGILAPEGVAPEELDASAPLLQRSVTEKHEGNRPILEKAHTREGWTIVKSLMRHPHQLFIQQPLYTLAITIPFTAIALAYLALNGVSPTTWQGMIKNPVMGTVIWLYIPIYVILLPMEIFYEWHRRRRYGILENLSENLRKLSSANDTGLTILESFNTVGETASGRLSTEFNEIHTKVLYGQTLRSTLLEFNNKYYIPRLARTVNLIAEAQETSTQITDVLRTAAQVSENQDEIEQDRKTRTRTQIVVIIMTFLTLLGVMAILKVQFLEVMSQLVKQASSSGSGGGAGMASIGNVNVDLLSMLFFHAVTLQAVAAGVISGYLRDSSIMAGLRYIIPLTTFALIVWVAIG